MKHGKKLKVLFHTDNPLGKTGFGRNAKALLSYLYKTKKYDIYHYCCSAQYSDPNLKRVPWKCFGSIPDNKSVVDNILKDQNNARLLGYGAFLIDDVIENIKPDVIVSAQDIWGIDFTLNKPWFNNINKVYWTTLDSLPILPTAIEAAKKVENFWVWSDFARKAMHDKGLTNVKTVHGVLDDKKFGRLKDEYRQQLREKNNISKDEFIIGFVFRNQLRKSVPNLLEGYALFKKRTNNVKSKLLLHTHWQEGWNIHRLCDEYGVDKNDILTTYVCKSCSNYNVQNFKGPEIDCEHCGNKKSKVTTGVGYGVTEEQLCEVYNMMDVYCHPFTSGGQEIPIQEAKLCELITLVTNYSCGEEMCYEEANSLALEWTKYTEHGTEFIKASTCPKSIAKQLHKVYEMEDSKKRKIGYLARKWTIDNFSVQNIGKKFEDYFDSLSPVDDYEVRPKTVAKDPSAKIEDVQDNLEWIKSLYTNILKDDLEKQKDGINYWLNELSKGTSRNDIEKYFRKVAFDENNKNNPKSIIDFLDKDDEGKRLLYVMPDSIGDLFLSTALFESLKTTYPDYNLYVATNPNNFSVLDGNPFVHKVIPYHQMMDNLLYLEGQGANKGLFEIAYLPHIGTQKMFTYQHNGKDTIALKLT
jgi:glycosyltransferase involved in cell wall biosynthesis